MTKERDIGALLAFIDSRQDVPHEWGRKANDCVGFALAASKAQTGRGRASRLTWKDQRSALRVLRKFGGSLEAAFDYFFVRIPPAMAMRGDIAGVPDDLFGIHPMIVEGELLVGPGDKGNKRVPRRMMTVAWSATQPQPKAKK